MELPSLVIGHFDPIEQLIINRFFIFYFYSMRTHCVPGTTRFRYSRGSNALYVQTHIQPGFGGRLD
jgi:hypothetical protein